MKTLNYLLGFGAAILLCGHAHAGLNVPYAVDPNTMHLWHFDDATNNQWNGNFITVTDAVTIANGGITLTNYGLGTSSSGAASGSPPFTNIMLMPNTAAYGTLGRCLLLTNGWGGVKVYAYCGNTNTTSGYYSDTTPFRNPDSGAFTFEALVFVNGANLFSSSIGSEWEIFCGDSQGEGPAGSGGARSWQFRLQPGGTPSLNCNFITASGGSAANETANLPTATGNDTVTPTTHAWYHVAVTYTGNAPTNTDTPGVLTFYWTLFDPTRTNADVLASFTNSAWGTLGGTPIPAIGGSARRNNGVGNAGGLDGLIDEVRISSICRQAGDLAFNTSTPPTPPTIVAQPLTNTLVGYGQPLSLVCGASGSLPLSFQWQETNSSAGGWTNVPGQTANTLSFNPVTFGDAGAYRVVVTNQYGTTNSVVAQVTVGAAFSELFGTGYDTNGVYDTTLAGNTDPHYFLVQSADPNNLGPATIDWSMTAYPIAADGGFFANPDGASSWIGPTWNNGGAGYTSPSGTYDYRITFLLDSVDTTKPATLEGTWWTGNVGTNIALNGQLLGFSTTADQQNTGFGFTITNGFVPGLNTLDFLVPVLNPNGSYQESALRVEISGIGLALPPGAPVITAQPANQTVTDGAVDPSSLATFSVVALGRPPLSYQWYADDNPVSGGTNRTLQFVGPQASAPPGTNFAVIVSNSSGSITSKVAVLTIVPTNQPPVVANYSIVLYSNTVAYFNLDTAFEAASDPSGNILTLGSPAFDSSSTNGGSITQSGVLLTYTPVTDYLGQDEFNYYITDGLGDTSTGMVNISVVPLVAPSVFGAKLAAGNIQLTGSGASPGGSFQVLATTNLLTPRTNWVTVTTGNFDGSGKFNVPLPISPAVPQTFYLISVP